MAFTTLAEWFNPEEVKMPRPEKMFRIDLQILDVPQSKLMDWLNDITNMDCDSTVTITEVDIPFEQVIEETKE